MSERGVSSIMCETCGGWHPTEAHAQFEKEAREKRMAEIKTRPDSVYRFDALGFTPEKNGEIEPWMHEVIEKAKDLGDHLQNSQFYIHAGPLGNTERTPSVLSMITQDSFREAPRTEQGNSTNPFVSQHESGEGKLFSWAADRQPEVDNLLVLQERWVQTRNNQDLEKYQEAIKDFFIKRIETLKENLGRQDDYTEQYRMESEQNLKDQEELIRNLDTMEGRKKAMKYILIGLGRASYMRGKEMIGIIFQVGDSLHNDTRVRMEQSRGRYNMQFNTHTYDPSTVFYYNHEEVIRVKHNSEGFINRQIVSNHEIDTNNARTFYNKFIHALYVPHGSIEEQREVLERMLDMTKDHPERRLPIYNFYGKLVWPRPPREK